MRILAYPTSRAALIESGALPACAELLRIRLEEFSEDAHCAGWISGIEFDVWIQAQEESIRSPKPLQLNVEQHAEFRKLSELIGGWVTRLANDEYVYLPDIVWIQLIRDTQSDAYLERVRQANAKQLLTSLNAIHAQASKNPELSEEEVNKLIDEVRDEIETEKKAGTYVEPVGIKHFSAARKAYDTWRKTGLVPDLP